MASVLAESEPGIFELDSKNWEVVRAEGAPFAKLEEHLRTVEHAEFATGEHIALARLASPIGWSIWQKGSYAFPNPNYIPKDSLKGLGLKKPAVLWTAREVSPILKHPLDATAAHMAGKEYYILQEDLQAALDAAREDAQKPLWQRRALLDERVDTFEMPSLNLHEDLLGQFVFGRAAEQYGARLVKEKVGEVSVYLVQPNVVNGQKKPFAQALWFRGVDDGSGLGGNYGGLVYDGRARGVRQVAPLGAAPNAFEVAARACNYETPEALRADLARLTRIRDALK